MFGDEVMMSSDVKTIDNKHRIVLPTFTNALKDDKLLLYSEEDFFSIYLYDTFFSKLSFCSDEKFDSLDDFLKRKAEIDKMFRNLDVAVVDGFRRIILPQFIMKQYDLHEHDSVLVYGANDHLNVENLGRVKVKSKIK